MQKTLNKEYLQTKEILILSDTHYPHTYIRDFLTMLDSSRVFIYCSPASTAKFMRIYLKFSAKKQAKIIKDKNYKMFFNNHIDKYVIVIFFGKKKTKETPLLDLLSRQLLLTYKDIIIVTEEGVDYDEDSALFG